jgi:hypothetical protein
MSQNEEENENIGLQQILTSKRALERTLLDLGADLSSTYANKETERWRTKSTGKSGLK